MVCWESASSGEPLVSPSQSWDSRGALTSTMHSEDANSGPLTCMASASSAELPPVGSVVFV